MEQYEQFSRQKIRAHVEAWKAAYLFPPQIRHIHEGWNEDGRPYVYCRRGLNGAVMPPKRGENTELFQEFGDHQPLNREERVRYLGKIWLVLKYFYPYLDLAHTEAENILPAWIAAVEAAERPETYYAVLERFLATLRDSHARLVTPYATRRGCLPVTFASIEERVVIAETAPGHGVEPGDEVLTMGGVSLHRLREEWQCRISASSPQAFTRDFLWRLRQGPPEETVELTVSNQRGRRAVLLTYANAETPSPEPRNTQAGYAWLRGAAYIRAHGENLALMRPFNMPDVQTLRSAFSLIAETSGLVLDLRGYPNTHFQHELTRCLCDCPVPSPRYEIPVVSDPDLNTRTWKLARHTIRPAGRSVYDKPVVALIDETTQSSAEDFCMYLRIARRVTFVGRPTAGCVGNLTTIDLPGGGWASFTGMRVTWPDGSPMWGIGIQPDVPVQSTLDGLKAGRDEIEEHGIEILKGLIRA
jgi:hypothetical protein